MSKQKQRPTTDMTEQDWIDVSESEFVDIVQSPITDKIGFVFEHDEIGLHGFEYQPDAHHVRGVSYERTGEA